MTRKHTAILELYRPAWVLDELARVTIPSLVERRLHNAVAAVAESCYRDVFGDRCVVLPDFGLADLLPSAGRWVDSVEAMDAAIQESSGAIAFRVYHKILEYPATMWPACFDYAIRLGGER